MDDQKRGRDAAEEAPRPREPKDKDAAKASERQDAPNYADRTDRGSAIKDDDLSSANDE